jgi:hypothetical protein
MFVIRERLYAHPVCTLGKGFNIQHFGLIVAEQQLRGA